MRNWMSCWLDRRRNASNLCILDDVSVHSDLSVLVCELILEPVWMKTHRNVIKQASWWDLFPLLLYTYSTNISLLLCACLIPLHHCQVASLSDKSYVIARRVTSSLETSLNASGRICVSTRAYLRWHLFCEGLVKSERLCVGLQGVFSCPDEAVSV